MLQIAFIRENKEKVVKALAKRNIDAKDAVEEIVQLDERRRATQVELDNTLAESNKLSKDIGEMMKGGEKEKAAHHVRGRAAFTRERNTKLRPLGVTCD